MNRLIPPLMVLSICAAQYCVAETLEDFLQMDIATLASVEVGPSADASLKGLTSELPGQQVADGGQVGLLGNRSWLQTPFSQTSYTQEFIVAQQAAGISDVLQFDPSVRVTRGFGNFQQAYMVRGFPIFSDDMTYNGLFGMLPRQYLAAELVERVEILRGANAFLMGSTPGQSGLGGAINVLPKRAPNDDLTRLTVGMRSGEQGYLATDLGRRNSDKTAGVRFIAVQRNGDSPVNGESKALELASLSGDFRRESVRVSTELGFQDHHLDATTPNIDVDDNLAIPHAPTARNAIAQPWTYSDESDLFGNVRAEYDFNQQLTGWIAGGVRSSKEKGQFSASLSVHDDAGDFTAQRFRVHRQDNVSAGNLGVRMQFDRSRIPQQLTVSASTFRNDSRNAYETYDAFSSNLYHPVAVTLPSTLTFSGGDFSDPHLTSDTRVTSLAIAHESQWFNDALHLLLGESLQFLQQSNFDYSDRTRVSFYHDHAFSPAVGMVYAITPQLSAHVNYQEGLQNGDIAPASNSRGPVANVGEALAPFHTKQVEVGVKYMTQHFGTEWELYEIRKPVAGFNAQNALVQRDEQTNRGLEWSLFGAVTQNIRMLGGISLLDAGSNGRHAIGSPRMQSNANVEWDVPKLTGLTLDSHLMYTAHQYANDSNTQSVPAWHRWDVGMRYSLSYSSQNKTALQTKVTLRLRVENVENRNYWASSGGYPGEGYLTLGTPRTLIFSSDFDF